MDSFANTTTGPTVTFKRKQLDHNGWYDAKGFRSKMERKTKNNKNKQQ